MTKTINWDAIEAAKGADLSKQEQKAITKAAFAIEAAHLEFDSALRSNLKELAKSLGYDDIEEGADHLGDEIHERGPYDAESIARSVTEFREWALLESEKNNLQAKLLKVQASLAKVER